MLLKSTFDRMDAGSTENCSCIFGLLSIHGHKAYMDVLSEVLRRVAASNMNVLDWFGINIFLISELAL